MAVLQPKNLYRGFLSDTNATLYTAPATAGDYAIVKEILLCNTDTVAHTVNIHNVVSAGSAADSNKILSDATVDPGVTVVFEMSCVLGAGDTLRADVDTASTVTAVISGVEYDA